MTDLASLPVGQTARVLRVGLPPRLRLRLGVFGLLAGRSVRAVRVAPFGDPIEFEIGATRLAMRRSEARLVTIEAI